MDERRWLEVSREEADLLGESIEGELSGLAGRVPKGYADEIQIFDEVHVLSELHDRVIHLFD